MRKKTILLLVPLLLFCSCNIAPTYSDANDFPKDKRDSIENYIAALNDDAYAGSAYEKNGDYAIFIIENSITPEIQKYAQSINDSLPSHIKSRVLTKSVKYSMEELYSTYRSILKLVDGETILSVGVSIPQNKVTISVRKVTKSIEKMIFSIAPKDQVNFDIIKGELERH